MNPNTMTGVATADRFVYASVEPRISMRPCSEALGLVQMTASGVPVPPGFIITTVACGREVRTSRSW